MSFPYFTPTRKINEDLAKLFLYTNNEPPTLLYFILIQIALFLSALDLNSSQIHVWGNLPLD